MVALTKDVSLNWLFFFFNNNDIISLNCDEQKELYANFKISRRARKKKLKLHDYLYV